MLKKLTILTLMIFALHAQCDFGNFKAHYNQLIATVIDDADNAVLVLSAIEMDKQAYITALENDDEWKAQEENCRKTDGTILSDNKIAKRIAFLQNLIDENEHLWNQPL